MPKSAPGRRSDTKPRPQASGAHGKAAGGGGKAAANFPAAIRSGIISTLPQVTPRAVRSGYDEHGFPIPKTGGTFATRREYVPGRGYVPSGTTPSSRAVASSVLSPEEAFAWASRPNFIPGTGYVGVGYEQPPGAGMGGGLGGGGGGGAPEELMALHDIRWKAGTWESPGGKAPSWWQSLQPENSADLERPDVAFLMNLNSMIPYMSPEDQRKSAAQLYSLNADAFSRYKPEFINVDTPVSGETAAISTQPGLNVIDEDYFTGSQRARDAIRALSNMRNATVGGNRWKFGPGYTWLQQVLGAVEAYGGGALDGTGIAPGNTPINLTRPNIGRRTRSQELALLGQLDPLLAQGESSDIGPFGAIGRTLAQPFFSQGVLSAATRGEGGPPIPGRRSRLLRF